MTLKLLINKKRSAIMQPYQVAYYFSIENNLITGSVKLSEIKCFLIITPIIGASLVVQSFISIIIILINI